MNKLFLFIAALNITVNCFSMDCYLKKDTLSYFEIDMRSKSNHPIIMAGMANYIDFQSLSLDSGKVFLESFYKQVYYVPDLYKGYGKAVTACMGIEKGHEFLENHKNENQRLMNLIASNSIEKRITLNNGENVFIRIAVLIGSFWVVGKETVDLSLTSNEINIKDMNEINEIYIPFDICTVKKPRRKYLKEMFK